MATEPRTIETYTEYAERRRRPRAALVVISAEAITGPYDVIARAQTENVDVLGKLVVSRIHLVGGVTRTLTCPIVHL
jgi:DNA-binding Lrp family transcriptional regulator